MSLVKRVLKFVSNPSLEPNSDNLANQLTQLNVEMLEPRMMLSGTSESMVFRADFEDVEVEQGGFAFFNEVSGLTSSNGSVEVQHNHPSVGPAASGEQHLELDGVNSVFVDLAPTENDLRLQFEYSARPGADADLNTIEIFYEGQLVDTVSADGSDLRTTDFNVFEFALSGTDASEAAINVGRLEFRSNSPDDIVGLGGLLDDIVVFEQLDDLELASIADQEVEVGTQLNVSAELLPPDDAIQGSVFSIVDGPVGATIDAETGLISFDASEANIEASNALNDRTVVGDPELVFSSGFEDVEVESGGFDFFTELSGFVAEGRGVEVQDSHPSVGDASEGQQHVELDGNNRISRDVETAIGDQYELVLDFSARPGVSATDNAVDIFWDGQLLDTVTADGSGLNGTDFNEFRFDLSSFSGELTTLTLASRIPGSVPGLGGLVDNVRLFRRTVEEVDGPDGKYTVTVQVETPDGRTDTESFLICIVEGMVDHAPELQPIADQRVDEQQLFLLTAQATDADLPEDSLAYSIVSGPDGLVIDATTGEISWTPTEAQGPGQYEVTLRVTDTTDLFDEATFNILVGEVGTPPELAPIADRNIQTGESLDIQLNATDSDVPVEELTFELVNAPEGATITPDDNRILWTPSAEQGAGEFEFEVQVTDSTGLFDRQSFIVFVTTPIEEPTSELSGFVFEDTDQSGTRDDGEFGRAGRLVFLDENDNQEFDEGEFSAITAFDDAATLENEEGQYVFSGLAAGNYTIRTLDLTSNEITAPDVTGAYTVSVDANEALDGFDFGSYFVSGSISGTKFLDTDGDGLASSSPVVFADGEFDDSNWEFRFIVSPEEGTGTGVRSVATEDGIDGAFHAITNTIPVGEFVFSESINRAAVYEFSQGAIESIDFSIDTRQFNPGDTAIQLVLEQDGTKFYNVPYDGFTGGWSTFTATYTADDFDTNPNVGVNSPGEVRDGVQPDFSENAAPITFGYLAGNTAFGTPGFFATSQVGFDNWQVAINREAQTVSGFQIYLDQNDNGQLDEGERSTLTDSDGNYRFDGLPEGQYIVREVQQAGFRQVSPGGVSNLGDGFADVVLDFFDSGAGPVSGPYGGFFAGSGIESVPTSVVLGNTPDDFLSLPTGSSVTVGFTDEVLVDGPGNDLFIQGVGAVNEFADVFISSNGQDFVFLGQITEDTEDVSGLDFASIDFNLPVTAVRIVGLDNGGSSPGFDVVSVQGLAGSIASNGKHTIDLSQGEDFTEADFVNEQINRAPVIVSEPPNLVGSGTEFQYDVDAVDPDDDQLVYSIETGPEGIEINPNTGLITWDPEPDFARRNLITNSSFDEGLSGFSTEYIQGAFNAQSFAVTTNPSLNFGNFADFGDNTTGDGNLLLVNGATTPDVTVWETTVAVNPNTNYLFSTAIATIFPVEPALLNVTINGELLTEIEAPDEVAIWESVASPWNSGAATSATIRITDLNLISFGNDFALDDIKFEELLTSVPVVVRATDPLGLFDEQRFEIELNSDTSFAPRVTSEPPRLAIPDFNYEYQVEVSDFDSIDFQYRLLNAPAGMTISADGLISWTPTADDLGVVTVEIEVTDLQGNIGRQNYSLEVSNSDTIGPEVSIFSSGNQANPGDPITFTVSATDNLAVETLQLIVDGEDVALDSNGRATVVMSRSGVIAAVAIASDAADNSNEASTSVRVFDPTDQEAPTVEILSPSVNSEVTYLTDVVATINDANLDFYRVEFARASDVDLVNLAAANENYQLISSGTGNVEDAVVGTFDPTVLANDTYVIRVLAQDVNGLIQTRGTLVNVIGDAKLGNFRLDFTDLSIPLAGIPIQINRGYDTLNANDQLSGGFGWDIGLADPDIRETVPDNGGGFFTQNGYKVGTRVFITTPDGRRVGFTFQPTPVGSLLGTSWRPAFVADDGVNLTLEDAAPPVTLGQLGDGSFGVGFFGFGIGGYNPTDFVLTTEDGTRYFYNQDTGLTGVEDTNGNSLTVTDDAITHSGGESIQFVRDDQGRITSIIDPDGNAIQYKYDSNGDLISFTDQAGETTRYEYNADIPHYLERVIDPNGIVTASVQYDENNRFVALVDALGNEITQEFDLDAQTFSQTDANGNVTFVRFDDRGNVVEETDAEGNTTLYEYDDDRNPTLETAITDRNGNTTRFAYDGRGNTVLIEDENGQFTRFQYDGFNNVTQIIGPADADPGDGYADTLVDSFFQAGEVTGLTVREDLDDNNEARVLDSADVILGVPFDPDTETGLDSDHIVLDAGDFVTVAFDEVVIDQPGDDLFVITPRAFGNFSAAGRTAEVSVSTDGVTFVSVGQVEEEGVNSIDLADSGITEEIQLVRITAGDAGPDNIGYVLTAIQAAPADNPSTRFEYDSAGNLTLIENQLGDTASFTYDGFGRRLTFVDFNGNETSFEYTDSDGNPDVIRFADGAYQELEYNQFGQTTRESFFEADGTLVEQSQSVYDDAGRLLETIDGEGNRVVRTYEGNNLVSEQIVNPDSPDETVDTPLADRLGRITEFEYDNAGRVIRQTDAEGGVVEFRYDGNGNRILLRDPVGNITTWIYDSNDRIVEERDPLFNEGLSIEEAIAALATPSGADVDADLGADHVRVFDYDAEGNQIERIDRNGRRIESVYDESDRLLQELWFSASGDLVDTIEFTYDARGNQLTATDSDSALTFDYDELNRLISVSNAGTAGAPTTVLEYEYDAQGNVVLTVDNSGVSVESTYDVRNRLASRLWFDADGNEVDDARVDYLYNAAGRVSQISRYSDLLATTLVGTTDRTYDLAGRSDILTHLGSVGELIASYDYDYDFGGLLIAEDRQHQLAEFTQSAQYSYDRTGQLLSAIYTGQPDEFFNYDANGNRESDSRPESVYSTETGNRLTSDGLFDYEYDGEGNLVLRTKLTTDEDGQAGETTEYVYDHRNRLIEVTITSEGGVILDEVSYAFDALGRRIARTENGETIHFVYNGDNVWADFDEAGEAVARYLFGDNIDENIARIRPGEGTVWYLTDRLGTIRDLAGASGQLLNHTEYQSFGRILSQFDNLITDRYFFTGREFDQTTNEYYYRSRVFDPITSRFNSDDPIGFAARDFNLKRYINNSPTNATDPTGLTSIFEQNIAIQPTSALAAAGSAEAGLVIRVSGCLGAATIPIFSAVLSEAFPSHELVFDLADVAAASVCFMS